jgi:hypothetical protein
MSEKMVTPQEIATVYQGSQMLRKLPKRVQTYFVNKGAKEKPYIGFVVEPYSVFLAFEIKNEKEAQKVLPDNYELLPCSFYEKGETKKCAIIGCFNIHSSFFWGTRYELYLIARNRETNLLTWIICDYESNTISYDPGQGFIDSTVEHSVCTTTFDGQIIIDMKSKKSANELKLVIDTKKGKIEKLNKRLWIEGNLSVDYAGKLNEVKSKPFGLIFDPNEMEEVVRITIEKAEIEKNSIGNSFIAAEPFEICYFSFAQHFITTSFPGEHHMKTAEDLEKAVKTFVEKN